jgi:non-specific serine/threonine protein kinase
MPPEQAVEYALEAREPVPLSVTAPRQPAVRGSTNTLSHREGEVAALLARGLTNRQIAKELVLSEHTVATHVRQILKKLGLHSRTQVAAWLIERQPLP